ncbi:hypothetical protein A2J03_03240 [Rhodococcus sp. EPR-157]|uniref:lipopolysaccharide biosynthesis protein n=1 Tax=Rhodococcus sp. EPR-157 TaxID=1813677 RepID=UPI0007BB59CA|nr:lipopolysaccharide biosynthesis protein [Rhodococcus sp. EPR-157]KZF09169.1 hypothetical protein A2J03_03240 [Rhodococcus sp. EPR-157]
MKGGIGATLAGQILRFGTQILSLAILSRILEPADFGAVAMVSSVIGVAAVLSDFGLSMAAIQRRSLSDHESSTLFWINTAIGIFVCGCINVAAGPVADFYGSPSLQEVISLLSLVFLFNGMSVQFRVLLTRRLRFGTLALVEILPQILGLVIAVVLALSGLGVYALAWQQVAVALVGAVGLAAASRWVPSWPRRGVSIRAFLGFSAATTLTQLVNYLSVNLQTISVGRVLGASMAGVYNRSFQLFMLPLSQIAAPMTRVLLPHLSRQVSTENYGRSVTRLHVAFSYVLVPVLVLLGINAALVSDVVLGSQWSDAESVIRILAFGGVFQALGYVYYWIFLSEAKMGSLLLAELPGRVAMIFLTVVLCSSGVEYVAFSYAIGCILIWLASTFMAKQRSSADTLSVLFVSMRLIIVTLLSFMVPGAVTVFSLDDPLSEVAVLLISNGLLLAICTVSACLPCYRRDIRSILAELPASMKSR